MNPIQQTEHFTIRTYEIDNNKIATLPALVKLMHEAAMQNVIQLKLSVWDLEPQHISWVLMRKKLEIERLPKLGERIKVLTHPAGFEKFFTYRDYKVFDQNEQLIAWSSSTWLLMNTVERKLSRIPDFILEYRKQMPKPEDCLPRPADKLPKMDAVEHAKTFEVNWYDLDFNMHLSNTLYVKWMLEALPDAILQEYRIEKLEMLYRAEGVWKDTVLAETSRDPDGDFLHRLVRESDGKELALGRSSWRPQKF